MKKTIVLVSVVTLLFIMACGVSSGFGFRTIKGSGEVITVKRDVSGFDRVAICCGMTLILSQGEIESLEIKADDNFMAEGALKLCRKGVFGITVSGKKQITKGLPNEV